MRLIVCVSHKHGWCTTWLPWGCHVLQFSCPKNTLEEHITENEGHAWQSMSMSHWPALCVCRDYVACVHGPL